MKDIEKIKEIILDVAAETINILKKKYPNFPLGYDGYGICAVASEKLSKCLKNDARLKDCNLNPWACRGNTIVSPYYNSDREGIDIVRGHYYVILTIRRREYILDISATQFNNEETEFDEIVFKPKSELRRTYFDFLHSPRWIEKSIRAIERERKNGEAVWL